ncbi:MAG: 4Fe-4S ferredoxin [Acidobacteria bacterium]|nr:MAG: 4Fe-4S ferredoxin [Acidobacteriota bacterium]
MPHRWGMAVDLDRCTGCGACVTACHAENNIPTVGDSQAARGRAMHWIRVERYWEGEYPDVTLKFRPVMCQQCDAYNRCVGTRYCSNNCPYKVRRFNFLDWNSEFREARAQVRRLLFNPDVTVRMRGVMEKCTFCVQRIHAAAIDAKAANRELKDGEIQPACVQSCSAKALVFGDLNDPDSEVSKLSRSDRGHKLLDGLGTLPKVTYLNRPQA